MPCAPLKLSKIKRCLEGNLSIDMRLVRLRNKVRQIDGLEGFLDVCLVRLRNEVRQIDGLRGYWMCALCTSEIMLDKEREERQF